MTPSSLTIVVPVFNEERRLPSLLEKLEGDVDVVVTQAGFELSEVIVVDDGSTDGTAAMLDAFEGLPDRFRVLRFERNRGKGAAVREGMLGAQSSFVLMTDVDLSTPLEDVRHLAAALERGADVAIGSRALKESQVLVHQPLYRELMGKTFNLLVRALVRVPWRDTQCGNKHNQHKKTHGLFELQRVEGFAFDVEVLVLARRLGLRVAEVPVRWVDHPDTRVGVVSSSATMALDAIRIAYRARRPLPLGAPKGDDLVSRRPGSQRMSTPTLRSRR
jgi:dolichyl-phosphate beta-glucosyltransferase